jgi:adenylate cyclase class IV
MEETTSPWEPRSLIDIISSARGNFSKYNSQMASGNPDEAAQALEELGKNLDELEKYRDLLQLGQADILLDLIKSLSEASDVEAEASDAEDVEAEDTESEQGSGNRD